MLTNLFASCVDGRTDGRCVHLEAADCPPLRASVYAILCPHLARCGKLCHHWAVEQAFHCMHRHKPYRTEYHRHQAVEVRTHRAMAGRMPMAVVEAAV